MIQEIIVIELTEEIGVRIRIKNVLMCLQHYAVTTFRGNLL